MVKPIIVGSLILGLLILSPLASADGTNPLVKVLPASIDASVGEEFSIEILVDPADYEVFAVQYDLVYDSAVLEALSQEAGDFLSKDGARSIEVTNNIDNEQGILEYGETRMGVTEGVTDAGVLASVRFRVTGDYGSELELTNVMVANPVAEKIPSTIESGICAVDGKTGMTNLGESPMLGETDTQESTLGSPGFGMITAWIGILILAYAFKRRF